MFNAVLTLELSLDPALHGPPMPGATIPPLPADAARPAPDVPAINCAAPLTLYKLTKVAATIQP